MSAVPKETSADQRLLLRRTMRGVWPQLPLLLLGSVVLCLAAVVVALVAPGATPVSVLLLAVLVAPPAVALGAVTNSVLRYDDASFAVWRRGWRVGIRRGIACAIPQAVAGALFVVAIEVWRRTGQPALLVSVAVCGAVTLALIPFTAAMVQVLTVLPELTLRDQWRVAAGWVVRWPVRFLAAPILLLLGVWLATQLSVSLLLLVPAPVAFVSAAALWTSAVESGRCLMERDPA
ncbi:hypothetical protein [Flexivirga caeni]|uniref:DUF624 domain-containing protein n=1 Tax=Flexivirga caeni TaxID=2294115 RepID=A0A3M9M3Z3_9MICO|nr:hypothetical protein [Flexivirga caeni]RNI20294.1 hypothetical protein EFY87_15195 [Flexivirga caeni]